MVKKRENTKHAKTSPAEAPDASEPQVTRPIKRGVANEDLQDILEMQTMMAFPEAVAALSDKPMYERTLGATRAALFSLKPHDTIEALLAAQMIGAHHAAMSSLGRASHPDCSSVARDLDIKNAVKLSSLFTKQVEALNALRGYGRRNVHVERVNVNAGGQAIVGDVTTGAAQPSTGDTASQAPRPGLEDAVEAPMTVLTEDAVAARAAP